MDFHGVGEQSHGQHDRQRAPGSLVTLPDASRVFKGMRMAGRMGGDRVKMKGLKVVKIFPEKNYILVSGSVPGHNGSIVLSRSNICHCKYLSQKKSKMQVEVLNIKGKKPAELLNLPEDIFGIEPNDHVDLPCCKAIPGCTAPGYAQGEDPC
jgi:hypothetical protein